MKAEKLWGVDMHIDAVWLLKNHKRLVSRRLFLVSLTKDDEQDHVLNEVDIIDTITYMHRERVRSACSDQMGSRAEYARMNSDVLRDNEREKSIDEWIVELRIIDRMLDIYQAIMEGLTKEEQALIRKHYDEKMPLSLLADIPLCDGSYPKSRSTLKRMLKAIEKKSEEITSLKV